MTKDEAWKMIEISLEYTYYGLDLVEIKEALQRPWVSLTAEEKDSLLLPFGSYWVIDAIEAKLKEKNGV